MEAGRLPREAGGTREGNKVFGSHMPESCVFLSSR